jgi:mRNA interferase MazF
MKKGDIILIPFPFTDMSGGKTRPALVLVDDVYDVTVAFITSKIVKKEADDVELIPMPLNGLKLESYVKLNKIATLEKQLSLGKLGELTPAEILLVDKGLIKVFDIGVL